MVHHKQHSSRTNLNTETPQSGPLSTPEVQSTGQPAVDGSLHAELSLHAAHFQTTETLSQELERVRREFERKVAELEATNNDLQNLLRSTDIATVFLDRQFHIRSFTPAACKLLNLTAADVGRALEDVSRRFSDETLLRDAGEVLNLLEEREAEVSTPDVRWYIRRILPHRTVDSCVDGVVITFTDITGRKRVEQQLNELARSLEKKVDQRTRVVRLLQDVAVISNEAASLEDAVRMTLERVCTEFGWPAGHAFLRDEAGGPGLVDAGLWYMQSPDALAGLVQARRNSCVEPGQQAAGRAVETTQPVWVHDVQHDMAFLRGLRVDRARIRAAFAFPILSGSTVAGVLEFFVTDEMPPDPDVISGMRELGTQLGRVVERQRIAHEVAEATAHEQRFVGQELHDTITQDIAGVSMLLAGLAQSLEAAGSPLADQARTISEHLGATGKHVRQLAHGMMPVEIPLDGLSEALHTLTESCRELHGVKTECDCAPAVRVDSSVTAMHLYRIAQEAMQNALRHAEAANIRVSLRAEDGQGVMTIRDDGSGFEHDESHPGGVGMQIMRYRVGMIGAALHVHSKPGAGTEVVCTFPCIPA